MNRESLASTVYRAGELTKQPTPKCPSPKPSVDRGKTAGQAAMRTSRSSDGSTWVLRGTNGHDGFLVPKQVECAS